MFKILSLCLMLLVITNYLVAGCLITNCPRGGKRSNKFTYNETQIKPCVSCGPGHTGQCFGPNICCGPFGCLMGTSDTIRCQREGFFHEREPCIAGSAPCRRNTGRCAIEGICCSQDACHVDKSCSMEEKSRLLPPDASSMDLYNFINYQAELSNEK